MGLEVRNLVRYEDQTSSLEKQWMANLVVTYERVQKIVNAAFQRAIPTYKLPEIPAILVIPNNDFARFIISGADHTEIVDPKIAIKKRREIVKDDTSTATGAYTHGLGAIILPESTAKAFQTEDLKSLAATCVLAEEYVHHITTVVSPENKLERMGFYDLGGYINPITPYDSGEVYAGNLKITFEDEEKDTKYGFPEISGEQSVILTENVTSLLVYLLAKQLGSPMLNNSTVLGFAARNVNDGIEHALAVVSPILLAQVIRAIVTGKEKLLDIDAFSPTSRRNTTNILQWMKKPNLRIMLLDPTNGSGDSQRNVFSYKDATLFSTHSEGS